VSTILPHICVIGAHILPNLDITPTPICADHPSTCPHASSNKRVFTNHHGLRVHLKLHEKREVEAGLNGEDGVRANGEGDEGEMRLKILRQ
jgi:general transcription factor IIIA